MHIYIYVCIYICVYMYKYVLICLFFFGLTPPLPLRRSRARHDRSLVAPAQPVSICIKTS